VQDVSVPGEVPGAVAEAVLHSDGKVAVGITEGEREVWMRLDPEHAEVLGQGIRDLARRGAR
jgi:hypothetical protein